MISSHVPNRELCEELKRLGYPQETEFSWVKEDGRSFGLAVYLKNENIFLPESDMYADNRRLFVENVAAPLVSEMAEWLKSTEYGSWQIPHFLPIEEKWTIFKRRETVAFEGSMPDAYATQICEILKAKEKI